MMQRKILSFVRRSGRLTQSQAQALQQHWPRWGVDATDAKALAACFAHAQPTVLEIGFGNGASLLSQAKAHPDVRFVGIEVHRPGVGRLLAACHAQGVENIRVINADAMALCESELPDDCCDRIQVFFPDPWPKLRHHKRRLIQAKSLPHFARVLKPAGLLHVATDWAHYAQQMTQDLTGSSCFSPGVLSEDGLGIDRPTTKYEQRGRGLGHEIIDLHYRCCPQ